MEPTATIFEEIMYPVAAYLPIHAEDSTGNEEVPDWSQSYLNPKNRIERLDEIKNPKWRMDGAEPDGTRFFAVPNFAIGKAPLRIDVFIPNGKDVPAILRNVLRPEKAMLLESDKI